MLSGALRARDAAVSKKKEAKQHVDQLEEQVTTLENALREANQELERRAEHMDMLLDKAVAGQQQVEKCDKMCEDMSRLSQQWAEQKKALSARLNSGQRHAKALQAAHQQGRVDLARTLEKLGACKQRNQDLRSEARNEIESAEARNAALQTRVDELTQAATVELAARQELATAASAISAERDSLASQVCCIKEQLEAKTADVAALESKLQVAVSTTEAASHERDHALAQLSAANAAAEDGSTASAPATLRMQTSQTSAPPVCTQSRCEASTGPEESDRAEEVAALRAERDRSDSAARALQQRLAVSEASWLESKHVISKLRGEVSDLQAKLTQQQGELASGRAMKGICSQLGEDQKQYLRSLHKEQQARHQLEKRLEAERSSHQDTASRLERLERSCNQEGEAELRVKELERLLEASRKSVEQERAGKEQALRVLNKLFRVHGMGPAAQKIEMPLNPSGITPEAAAVSPSAAVPYYTIEHLAKQQSTSQPLQVCTQVRGEEPMQDVKRAMSDVERSLKSMGFGTGFG